MSEMLLNRSYINSIVSVFPCFQWNFVLIYFHENAIVLILLLAWWLLISLTAENVFSNKSCLYEILVRYLFWIPVIFLADKTTVVVLVFTVNPICLMVLWILTCWLWKNNLGLWSSNTKVNLSTEYSVLWDTCSSHTVTVDDGIQFQLS